MPLACFSHARLPLTTTAATTIIRVIRGLIVMTAANLDCGPATGSAP
jgi:hypothetical protein